MALIGFAGDWHGNTAWAQSCLKMFASHGVTQVYHVGDFGVWPGPEGEKFLRRTAKVADSFGQTLYIVLGNHENYDRVARMDLDSDGWLTLPAYPALKFAPRAHAWQDSHGVSFAALGGAGSIDRNLREEGKTWWQAEEITDTDVAAFASLPLLRAIAGNDSPPVDIMLSHEAPAGLLRGGGPLPHFATPEVLHYCQEQRVRLRTAVEVARPRWLIHGHWHQFIHDALEGITVDSQEFHTQVIGLDRDGSQDNCVLADIAPGRGIVSFRILHERHE